MTFITKCDRILLQNAPGFLLQNTIVLLQNAAAQSALPFNSRLFTGIVFISILRLIQKLNTVRITTSQSFFKDTHREKAPSNKTPALTKSINMDIWLVGISNQFSIRDS